MRQYGSTQSYSNEVKIKILLDLEESQAKSTLFDQLPTVTAVTELQQQTLHMNTVFEQIK